MTDINKHLDKLSEHDQKYYRHRLSKISEAQKNELAELVEKLDNAGATKPLSWAWSEISEGIPQFARFRVLQELYRSAYDVAGSIDSAENDFEIDAGATYQAISGNLGKEKTDQFLIAYAKGMLYNLIGFLDEGNFEAERDGFSWRLMKTDEHGDKMIRGIDGLHEDFMEFDKEIK
jgi:hypothetical protein